MNIETFGEITLANRTLSKCDATHMTTPSTTNKLT